MKSGVKCWKCGVLLVVMVGACLVMLGGGVFIRDHDRRQRVVFRAWLVGFPAALLNGRHKHPVG